jgi:hypothetical protein
MFKKRSIKSIDIFYRSVSLRVEYKIANDSFEHAFGTHHLPDYAEIHAVFCNEQDITEMLVESQIEDIELILDKQGL